MAMTGQFGFFSMRRTSSSDGTMGGVVSATPRPVTVVPGASAAARNQWGADRFAQRRRTMRQIGRHVVANSDKKGAGQAAGSSDETERKGRDRPNEKAKPS